MKQHIQVLINTAIASLQKKSILPTSELPEYKIERTKDKRHGDFAANAALTLTKFAKRPPCELAELLIDALPESENVVKTEIAGPGFINFFLTDTAQHTIIQEIIESGNNFAHSEHGNNQLINLEFVSANPTGPLHVGHGRSAAYGDACANLLSAIGYRVHREYYVNDAGRQMDILATSIWLRYLILCGEKITFPSNGYKGDYVSDIAQTLKEKHGDALHSPVDTVFANIPADEPQGGDKEEHIDALIAKAKDLLGDNSYEQIHALGLKIILDDIRDDLSEFGVDYQEWFSERRLFSENYMQQCVDQLEEKQLTYKKDGNLWFKSTVFGDEKDRVLIRKNGQPTYFCADIANHVGKLERNADMMIDIFGSDHHGYVARVKAALTGLGVADDKLKVLLIQFVTLFRAGEKVQMSTRSGSFVTLRELREEVGNDAARYFYVMRKTDQHLDFDMDLATSKSNENPVFYIQYAHARICSVLRQAAEKGFTIDQELGLANLNLLIEPEEKQLVDTMSRYPDLLHVAALGFEPHLIANLLKDIANALHSYYNAHQFLVDHEQTRHARLTLIIATRQLLANGLQLLGVSAPEEM